MNGAGQLDRLAVLIRSERDSLLSQWRQRVRALPSAPYLDVPVVNDRVPQLIEELAAALEARAGEPTPERAEEKFDIEEVVAEYDILRGCIHDLALANGLTFQGKPFHVLNYVLGEAIQLAAKTFAAERELAVRGCREVHLNFMSNDVRTPLNAISLATRGLELALPVRSATAAHAQMLNSLRRNVRQLHGVVGKEIEQGRLASERGIELQRRAFDLWPLVEALVHELHPRADSAGTRLVNQVPEDLVAYADAGVLRRVFHDVIASAIADAPHGKVVIGARHCGADGTFECWVSDNGAGIAPERRKTGFDQAGLAIARIFVEAHDGSVRLESQEGLGSIFRFTLPRQSAATPEPAASPDGEGQ
jgi:signal transduction histidine kinase